ncbi:hypothetical protein [Sphingomonas sp.]|uniref:hypothetical protein n=1 Tax=Sphingomonas sp. TaxID=28214 RepID=UPI0035BBFD53
MQLIGRLKLRALFAAMAALLIAIVTPSICLVLLAPLVLAFPQVRGVVRSVSTRWLDRFDEPVAR